MQKRLGRQTVALGEPVHILAHAAVGGKMESEGPLGSFFDHLSQDSFFGEKSWEKAESENLRRSVMHTLEKGRFKPEDMDFAISGDLLNQCISSGYALRGLKIPFFGVYGACSTMAESLLLASLIISGGGAKNILCATSSHFCSAEKQFRTPLEYGGQRTPNAQWTVTGSGSVVVSDGEGCPSIGAVTCGRIIDLGVTDVGNMGAAMAPAFADTIKRHLDSLQRDISYYDLILSGDLGIIGKSIAKELLLKEGIDMGDKYDDCGAMIFDPNLQDTMQGEAVADVRHRCFADIFCPKCRKET